MHEQIISDCAGQLGVSPAVHPDDHIFNFLIGHQGFPSDETRVKYYFEDGRDSAMKLRGILSRTLGDGHIDILEFASGYGCVSRHLVGDNRLNLVSCDIHPQAISFLEKKIGVRALHSVSIPEELDPGRTYDAVFALSFFSHMPITTWSRWLAKLFQLVTPGGVLIFTTQGDKSLPALAMQEPPEEYGFRFALNSEQIDLPVEEYGQMVMNSDMVRKHIQTLPGAECIPDEVTTWWNHQDVFVVRKNSYL